MSKIAPLTQREFHISRHDLNQIHRFPSNFVKTAKYNPLDFFPKTIFLQFQRYANIYFLIIAILQSISVISPLNPFSAIAPFVVVIGLSLVREALEDLTRHRSDKEANARKCTVFKDGSLVDLSWKEVQVGDIVYVKDCDYFAADLLVIASANPNGLCFIETSSLDGEKNLKPRTAPKETLNLYEHNDHRLDLKGQISCIQSNPMLSSFEGTLTLEGGQKVILNAKQLLYRGAKLKNTAWVVGVAVYTGNDTKVMKNSESSKNKQSKIERQTNTLIVRIFVFQLLVCLIAATGAFVFNQVYLDDHKAYINKEYSAGLESLLLFFSYFLLNNTMIPISLIVSLEFVKLAQAYFINKDQELYNKESGRRATVFTSAINEELGQVEYLFTDKTGTLTCNKMEFKIAVIGDEMYGDTQILGNAPLLSSRSGSSINQIHQLQQPEQVKAIGAKESKDDINKESIVFNFADKRIEPLLKGTQGDKPIKMTMHTADKSKMTYNITKQSDLVKEYFTILSTCHECLVEKQSDGSPSFQGPSPDEVTLVDTAHRLGYSFIGGSENNKKITVFGEERDFQVLHSFEFNSDRKRMSVILKDSQGRIKLYIKGADTIIKGRLKHVEEQPYLKYIDKKLDIFARKGLRTLLIGMKVLDTAEYNAFLTKYMAVADSNEKEKEIDRLADEIERDLYLIGATAVEDRLQDNVPETIYDLIQANIKVWMLTGDKLETAENIAKSCNLVQDDFQVLQVSEKTKEEIQNILVKHKQYNDYFLANGIRKSLIIEGESLAIVLNDSLLTTLFISITKTCEAVVCCRVTPKQKADVVRLVKRGLGKITLAIGDGANDVNMIQEAHIGVGLYGQEGMRAVQSSDFALPEFQGLWRLLFVHGRWSYVRIAEMILYFFYKNMIFTIPQFYFSFVCAFSGQTVFDDFYITTYNLIFTAFPLLVRAAFDQDVNYVETSSDEDEQPQKRLYVKKYFPKLYYMGQQNKLFNEKKFFKSVLQGILHGALLFIVTFLTLDRAVLDDSGKNVDLYYISITLYTSIILVVDMKIAVYTRYWTILTSVSLVGLSLVLYVAYMWFVDSYSESMISQTTVMLFTSMHFYLILLLNLGIIFLFDMGYVYAKSKYYAELADYFRDIIKRKDYRLEGAFTTLFKPRIAIAKAPETKVVDIENQAFQSSLKPLDSERTFMRPPQAHESGDGLLSKSQNDIKRFESEIPSPSKELVASPSRELPESLVMESPEFKKEDRSRKPRQVTVINAMKKEIKPIRSSIETLQVKK